MPGGEGLARYNSFMICIVAKNKFLIEFSAPFDLFWSPVSFGGIMLIGGSMTSGEVLMIPHSLVWQMTLECFGRQSHLCSDLCGSPAHDNRNGFCSETPLCSNRVDNGELTWDGSLELRGCQTVAKFEETKWISLHVGIENKMWAAA